MAKHVVARLDELPEGGTRKVVVRGREIAVFNLKGEFYAMLDRCPHEGASLSQGMRVGLVESGTPGEYCYSRPGELVRCPWHGWEFDIRTGQSWFNPATIRVKCYAAAVEAGSHIAKGPYVAETFPVSVDEEYVVVDV